jgi:hypothetical protein
MAKTSHDSSLSGLYGVVARRAITHEEQDEQDQTEPPEAKMGKRRPQVCCGHVSFLSPALAQVMQNAAEVANARYKTSAEALQLIENAIPSGCLSRRCRGVGLRRLGLRHRVIGMVRRHAIFSYIKS